MELSETVCARDRAAWRAWLEEHHRTARFIWLVYYKKDTGKPSVSYEEAVQEAICFGWIDGQVRRVDEERYMQRYTPRTSRSQWSVTNVARAEEMIRQRRMTEHGLAVYHKGMREGALVPSSADFTVPEELAEALAGNAKARASYEALAPSAQLQYAYWIASAKTAPTRERRLRATVEGLITGRRPGEK